MYSLPRSELFSRKSIYKCDVFLEDVVGFKNERQTPCTWSIPACHREAIHHAWVQNFSVLCIISLTSPTRLRSTCCLELKSKLRGDALPTKAGGDDAVKTKAPASPIFTHNILSTGGRYQLSTTHETPPLALRACYPVSTILHLLHLLRATCAASRPSLRILQLEDVDAERKASHRFGITGEVTGIAGGHEACQPVT